MHIITDKGAYTNNVSQQTQLLCLSRLSRHSTLQQIPLVSSSLSFKLHGHMLTSSQVGISYASIFIVCYHITFWVFGAAHSISWDYKPGVPQKEAAEFRASWDQKPIGSWVARRLLRRSRRDQRDEAADEHPFELSQTGSLHGDIELSRRSGRATAPHSPDNHAGTSEKKPSSTTELPTPLSGLSPAASPTKTSLASKVLRAIYAGVNAVTVTLFASLLIALVPDLKALFVTSSRPRHSHWHGPDGRPPLAFILDTAALLGGITVPLSLILLGASFARLRLPRPLSRSPWIAMLAAAVAKTVVLPVIGIVVVTVMTRNGYLKKQDLVERFVAMIMAGTPAAINQLLVTGLWSSDGEVDTLSAFLFVQYVVALGTTA
jgi:predicted permease